jgi:hypothetical protein
LPKELQHLYSDYTGVPKLYLQVNNLQDVSRNSRHLEDLEVSVAVMFKGVVDERPGIYASYVTFDPSRDNAIDEAASWLSEEYVPIYSGTVLTDFDEHENHFPNARFSLRKIMNFSVTKAAFQL